MAMNENEKEHTATSESTHPAHHPSIHPSFIYTFFFFFNRHMGDKTQYSLTPFTGKNKNLEHQLEE